MKMRNKGKVHPSPSSLSSPNLSSANRDAFSVLKLLPAAILALVSVLSLEEKEVLAYMITRSIKSSGPASIVEEKKRSGKKSNTHKPPVFYCECFDCYTSYWFKWDCSPNRELIHQAIEAFEEHLADGEQAKKSGRGKKKDKTARRAAEKPAEVPDPPAPVVEDSFVMVMPEADAPPPPAEVSENVEATTVDREEVEEEAPAAEAQIVLRSSPANGHKGLARKVLPDVVGLLNSRLWSLWGPNA